MSLCLILLSLSSVLAYNHYHTWTNNPRWQQAYKEVLNGTASSPNRYRVLVPYLTHVAEILLQRILTPKHAFELACITYDATAFFLGFLALYVYLRRFFPGPYCLLGCTYLAALLPIALRYGHYQPWSWLELCLFSLGLFLLQQGYLCLFACLVVVASLNRETGVFLPFLYLICNTRWKNLWNSSSSVTTRFNPVLIFLGYLSLWVLTYGGLRHFLGQAPHAMSIRMIWQANIFPHSLKFALTNILLFMGFSGIFAILGFSKSPKFAQRSVLIVLLYLPAYLLFGLWREVRLLLPMYPVIMPLMVSFWFTSISSNHIPLSINAKGQTLDHIDTTQDMQEFGQEPHSKR